MKIGSRSGSSFLRVVVAAGLLVSALSARVPAEQAGHDWHLVPPSGGGERLAREDIIVEDGDLRVVVSARTGRATVHTLSDGVMRAEIDPAPQEGRPRDTRVVDAKASGPIVVAVVRKESGATEDTRAVYSFGQNGIIEIGRHTGVVINGPIDHAIIPTFVGGDLVFSPTRHPSAEVLHLPVEKMLVGLLRGGDGLLVVTRAQRNGTPSPLLRKSAGPDGPFGSLEFQDGDGNITLAFPNAPGIWHREALGPSFLERDVTIDWQRPFPANWKTQLLEDGVSTTYTFRSARKKRFWRGGVGTYTYPVWFDGEQAVYRLGKKIPPKGESLIYFTERSEDTPDSVLAAADLVRIALGDQAHRDFLDREGRERTRDGRPDHCVGTATCGVTDKLKPIFEEGKEVERRDYIESGIEDMIYHLGVLTRRVHRYRDFARDMLAYLETAKQEKPGLKSFIEEMVQATGEFTEAYHAQKENIKTLEFAEELGKETAALTRDRRPGNLAAFLKLKGKWTGMGGALEGMVRRLHTVGRDLSQRAGCGCVEQPEAVELAREIRRRVTRHLRNPIGYEMWSSD